MSGDAGDLEQALDELFASDFDDFVSQRARLAKQLRDAGNAQGAETIKSLRKPSIAAWVLNQLAHGSRHDVDLLLDSGHRLRESQAGMLSGGEKEAFERARKKESEALRRLTREAEKLLRKRGSGSSSLLNQVTESLRASAIFPTGRELLARGRFQQPMKPAGFEVVGELAGTARPGTDRKTQKADAAERHEASEALKDARRRHRDAEKQARQAAQKAERLQAQASDATSAAQEAKELARAAALELQQAEIRLERTKRS